MMYLERTGRRTLTCAAIAIVFAGAFYISQSPAQQLAPDPPKPADLKQQPGRFQIILHPQFRGDQYLLDTITGQIWQLTKFSSLDGEPLAWTPMAKIDNAEDFRAFYANHRRSPAAPTAASAPKLPKASGAPQRLNPMD